MQMILLSTQVIPTEWIGDAVDIGITPVLLILFVWYFLSRSRNDDVKVKEAYSAAQETIDEQNRAMREREDYLLAESAKREEIIRTESEKREKLIRTESEKRESILMASQERMLDTLDSIAQSLGQIEKNISRQNERLDAIEKEIRYGSVKGNGG